MHEYQLKQKEPSTPSLARMAGQLQQPWPSFCRGGCRRPASPARSPSFRSASSERSWRLLERMWSCTKPSWHWRASFSARESVSRGVPVSCPPRCARHKKDRRGEPFRGRLLRPRLGSTLGTPLSAADPGLGSVAGCPHCLGCDGESLRARPGCRPGGPVPMLRA